MVCWGEVSCRVKRAIVFHERFTIAQLTDSTNLTYEQVEQVVHRLVNRGDVRRLAPGESTEAEQEVERRVGRPCARYTLTSDPVRRAEFLADLEAMAAAARLELAPSRRPNTPYYSAALQAIETAEACKGQGWSLRLKEVEEFLTYGREYEALIPEGLEVVQVYYDLALARLKALGGQFAAAEHLLEQAGEALTRAGLEEEAHQVAERRLALGVERELAIMGHALDARRDSLVILERLRRSFLEAPWSPLLSPLRRAIELLAKLITPPEYLVATSTSSSVGLPISYLRESQQFASQLGKGLARLRPDVIIRQSGIMLGPDAWIVSRDLRSIELRTETWGRQQHRQQHVEILAQVERAVEQLPPGLPPPRRKPGVRKPELPREPGVSSSSRPPLVD